jgi:hypothetical protein
VPTAGSVSGASAIPSVPALLDAAAQVTSGASATVSAAALFEAAARVTSKAVSRVSFFPMGKGAAVAVVPIGVSLIDDGLREGLAEVVREAVDEALAPAVREALDAIRSPTDRGLAITYVGVLFAPASFVYCAVAGFADSEDAAYWSIVMLLVTAIALYRAGGRELLRRVRSGDHD